MIHRILSVVHPEGFSTTARDFESPFMASVRVSLGIITGIPSLGFLPVSRSEPRLMSPSLDETGQDSLLFFSGG